MKKLFAIAVLVALSLVGSASAGTVTFDGVNEQVNYTYTLGNTFSVSGLSLQTLFLGSTPYTINNGSLSLSSGSYIGQNTTFGTTIVGFTGGGSISITGSIPTRGINSVTTLLSGSFLGSTASFTPGSGGSFGGALDLSTLYINPYIFSGDVLTASDAQTIINVALGSGTLAAPGSFKTEISSSHVTLGVPEPGSLALLGLGTLALPMSFRKYLVRR